MNILVDGADHSTVKIHADHSNIGRGSVSERTVDKAESSGYMLDILGVVGDNSAYTEHGKSAEEIMMQAGQEDLTARRNYMAVMSNSMSDEDFAKMQKEGFHPGSTEIETVVSIIDHIKAALVKGGVEVAGYTDTLSEETLRDITGSEAFAIELKKQFAEHDVPVTEENVAAVMDAWKLMSQAPEVSAGSEKYMVENGISPTPESLYTAGYSAAARESGQGRGYYAAGEVAGYYAKKPEAVDFGQLLPQVQKIIEQSGYPMNEDNLSDAKWLVENGVPLTADTFSLLKDIRELRLPLTAEEFLQKAAGAIAQGTSPSKMDLSRSETIYEQAVRIKDEVDRLQDQAADVIIARNLPVTLRNLFAAASELFGLKGNAAEGAQASSDLRGRRLLEEIRLSMTVEANIRLLKRGYRIETAPLEDLVGKLKEAESAYTKALVGEKDPAVADKKKSLFGETLEILRGIRTSPAAILGEVSSDDTLREIHSLGKTRAADYEKAGAKYEELMTVPRQDMGDSIRKAFRNVDDILSDLELELTDENRRAVRILGYNSAEITKDNIGQIRRMDKLLTDTLKELKPGKVLQMIREGVNPLTMSVEELSDYLSDQETPDQEMASYSKFLYKLEKQKGITEEERSAYIGIYRLVRQVEKTDDAAVGAIWQSGMEFTLENLLSAVRSNRHKHMDYSVDESFGGVSAKDTGAESISDQIAKGFDVNRPITGDRLKEMMEQAGSEDAGKEFERMEGQQARAAMKTEESVVRELMDYGQPVTADHLLMAANMLKSPKEIWNLVDGLKRKEKEGAGTEVKEELAGLAEELGKSVVSSLEDREKALSGYREFCETVQNMTIEASYGEHLKALDVKAMSTLYKQMTFLGNMAKEENYEIPAKIGDTLTSINLKIIHNSEKESKAAIALETQELGRVAAQFRITDQGLTGFCVCSKEEGTTLLKDAKDGLDDRLSEEGILTGEIYFASSQTLNLTEFSLKQSYDRQKGADINTGTLYKAAKAFIGYVQEASIKKGNMAYEN